MTARVVVTRENDGAFTVQSGDSDGHETALCTRDRTIAMAEALARLGAMFERRVTDGTIIDRAGL